MLSVEMCKSRWIISTEKEFLLSCIENGLSSRDVEKAYGYNNHKVVYWMKKLGLSDMSKYRKHKRYSFDKIDTKEKAYMLGFILADGAICDGMIEVTVAIQDKDVADFIANIVDTTVCIDTTYNPKTRRFPRARLSKKIADITKFTGSSAKCDRHYPRIRSDLERYLIQGLFDADGCITWGWRKDKNRMWQKVSFTSQLKILEGVQQYLIKALNISTVLRPKTGCDCYVLEFSNLNDVLHFCEHIYDSNDMIVLKRKHLKYNALRLELEENGETSTSSCQYRAKPTEWEGVETSGESAMILNNRSSIQGCDEQLRYSPHWAR